MTSQQTTKNVAILVGHRPPCYSNSMSDDQRIVVNPAVVTVERVLE